MDERDASTQPRVIFYLEHAVQDASLTRTGERRVISRRILYVEIERSLGFEPTDREFEKLGYDIESRIPGTSINPPVFSLWLS